MDKTLARPCALCLEEHQLRHSHILPEFFYKPVYGDKHEYKLVVNRPDGARAGTREKGLREYLLCHGCEQSLGRYESYGAVLLRAIDDAANAQSSGDVILPFDAHRFRLFSLSLLWRAGVAKGTMFRSVRLGPHEERLRRMLQTEDPEEPFSYGFLLARMNHVGLQYAPIIAPTAHRFERFRIYRLNALGYLWQFYVDSDLRGLSERTSFVGSTEHLMVPQVPPMKLVLKRRSQ